MTNTDRPRWEPVAWCGDCRWYLPADEAGTRCPGDTCRRILRRRRMRICRRCETHEGFLGPHGDLYDKHVAKEHVA